MASTFAAAALGGFHFVSPGCSWYEHHMMGGCQRPPPNAECAAPPSTTTPDHAPPRRRRPTLAVIVPYRGADASASLAAFCAKLPAHLARHGVRFSLLAVAQVDALPFNRAALANAGFELLRRGALGARARLDRRADDYVAVQDVDRWPVDASEGGGGNRTCAAAVADYYSHPAEAPRVLHPSSYTGGVLLVRAAQYEAVNGFSNRFWGWGHEDNEMFGRLRWCGLTPRHGALLDDCMVHRDCSECARAKPQSTSAALLLETRNIALAQVALRRPREAMRADGLSTLNFSLVGAPRQLAGGCGGHTLHIVDVALRRAAEDDPDDAGVAAARGPCVADGGARDDGCTAPVAPAALPPDLVRVSASSHALPRGAALVRVVAATRARVMYNYHYELDLLLAQKEGRRAVHRVAVCSQEWQPADVPPEARYHLMWRAVARAHAKRPNASGAFRLAKDFEYRGHFPCSASAPPVGMGRAYA